MNLTDRLPVRDADAECHYHRGCGAVVSVGAYGDWHYCEACEVTPRRSRPRFHDSICLPVNA